MGPASGGPSSGIGTWRGSRASAAAISDSARRRILDAAGHWPLAVGHLDRQRLGPGLGDRAVCDAPARGLERRRSAHLRGNPQRAAEIVAEPEWGHAGGERSGFAARGAARRTGGIPGVQRASAAATHGVPAGSEFRQVGARERDGPRRTQALDHRRVLRGNLLCERRDPPRRGRSGDVDILLHRERDPGQRTELLAPGDGPVDHIRRGARLALQRHSHGVDRRIDRGDPRQMGVDHLGRRKLTRRDEVGEFDRALAADVGHEAYPVSVEYRPLLSGGTSHCFTVARAPAARLFSSAVVGTCPCPS